MIKPLWSPLVQRIGTRRGWVIVMQLLVGARAGAAALAIPAADFVRYTLAAFAFVAVALRRRTTWRRTGFTCWRYRVISRHGSSAFAARLTGWR